MMKKSLKIAKKNIIIIIINEQHLRERERERDKKKPAQLREIFGYDKTPISV